MFTEKDLIQLQEKGITPQLAQHQIERFKSGFPFIRLAAAATPSHGIVRLDENQLHHFVGWYDEHAPQMQVLKFVPASGAATRMFKDLFTWREKLAAGTAAEELMEQDEQAREFFTQLRTFAFWDDLERLMGENGKDALGLWESKNYLPLLETLLSEQGLGYALLPKGLLRFHRYNDHNRTAFEEHLAEGAQYARSESGKVNLHFTVSAEHRGRFINHTGDVLNRWEEHFDANYEVKFSVQKPSTDTLAVDMENKPFRDHDGSLLFRPGGHGALIQNLNELKEDLIFIKNIDNVVPDRIKEETIAWKKALGGMLLKYREEIFRILEQVESRNFSQSDYIAARSFALDKLCIDGAALPQKLEDGLDALVSLLNRPIRICGMVKNVGEPGGGPFWVKDPNTGNLSLQIVESSQVDHNDKQQKEIFLQATHFNPVDLVCSFKDRKGKHFDLTQYTDPQTGFISIKSKDGKDLKAQELPGLWNGAMAQWITLFVEVPLITFNPVKTIMDLLRPEHR